MGFGELQAAYGMGNAYRRKTCLTFLPRRGCVVIGEMKENVMPNLFRHLIKSNPYETLKQVQGDN